MEARPGSAMDLTLRLDDQTQEALENLAGAQRCTVEEYVMALIRKAVRGEQKSAKKQGASSQAANPARAPMDDFLPDGVDPFAPAYWENSGRASSFADVQARMRFAGTPGLLRDE